MGIAGEGFQQVLSVFIHGDSLEITFTVRLFCRKLFVVAPNNSISIRNAR